MAKPRVTAEDFANWRESSVTQWVMEASAKVADANRQKWIDASWEGGNCDPLSLTELRTRFDAYRALIEMSWEACAEWLGETENENA